MYTHILTWFCWFSWKVVLFVQKPALSMKSTWKATKTADSTQISHYDLVFCRVQKEGQLDISYILVVFGGVCGSCMFKWYMYTHTLTWFCWFSWKVVLFIWKLVLFVKSTWKALETEKHMKSEKHTWKVRSTWKVKSTWKAYLKSESIWKEKSTWKVKSTWKTHEKWKAPLFIRSICFSLWALELSWISLWISFADLIMNFITDFTGMEFSVKSIMKSCWFQWNPVKCCGFHEILLISVKSL